MDTLRKIHLKVFGAHETDAHFSQVDPAASADINPAVNDE